MKTPKPNKRIEKLEMSYYETSPYSLIEEMKDKITFLYIDIMRELWGIYHQYIVHKGRKGIREVLICDHRNPYYILTPRLLRKQLEHLKSL